MKIAAVAAALFLAALPASTSAGRVESAWAAPASRSTYRRSGCVHRRRRAPSHGFLSRVFFYGPRTRARGRRLAAIPLATHCSFHYLVTSDVLARRTRRGLLLAGARDEHHRGKRWHARSRLPSARRLGPHCSDDSGNRDSRMVSRSDRVDSGMGGRVLDPRHRVDRCGDGDLSVEEQEAASKSCWHLSGRASELRSFSVGV